MIELKGKHNSAKIFTDLVDEASIAQISALLDQEFTENLRIRMMPDVHAGAGCTVGTIRIVCTHHAEPDRIHDLLSGISERKAERIGNRSKE